MPTATDTTLFRIRERVSSFYRNQDLIVAAPVELAGRMYELSELVTELDELLTMGRTPPEAWITAFRTGRYGT